MSPRENKTTSRGREATATLTQVVYAWRLGGQPSIIPISEPTSFEQLSENLASLSLELSPEENRRLTASGYHSGRHSRDRKHR